MALSTEADLLRAPDNASFPTSNRAPSSYVPLPTFKLPKGAEKHYQQQFADMYFARLATIKPAAETAAEEAWAEFEIGGEPVHHVERVLDVRQGELCWISGTVFMEMPLKPNVLDDLAKEHWIAAPPPREKFAGPDGSRQIMLEDESGRLRLTGNFLNTQLLVTGAIIAAMGTENADGEFEVIDIKFPDLPRQPSRWEETESAAAMSNQKIPKEKPKGGKIALVSGLGVSADGSEALMLDMLLEYLLGDSGSGDIQSQAAQVSRLVIVGNSFSRASPILSREEMAAHKETHKYGVDRGEAYNPAPSENLDIFLSSLLPSMPITLIPGANDPTNVAIPQQPLHPALFPRSRAYASLLTQEDDTPSWFDSVTNPWEGEVDGWRMLGNGGQPVDDIFKYVDSDDRLDMMEHILRWRCNAPTAPDTLWCYPYQDQDHLLLKDCPHVYFVGNQPRFDTTVIDGPVGQSVRLIAIPKFAETGTIVLLDAESLDVECVNFEVFTKSDDP